MDECNVVRISRRATPWFEAAFRTQALGQRVAWDMTFIAVQNEQGQMVPAFMIYAETPAHRLGHVHTQFAQMVTFGLTEDTVNTAVGTLLTRLHELRRAELNGAVNGGGKPGGGLVVPGA